LKPGGLFELVERPIFEPCQNEVLIKVEVCGICHSDQFIKDGLFPGLVFPRIPGHEVVGRITKIGKGVLEALWKEGMRVGVGWHGGHCFQCPNCRVGDFVCCHHEKISGVLYDGGYAEYMVANESGLVAVPDGLDSAEAAPLLCAGVTVFNSLRNQGARPPDVVAVSGIGGLGHIAIACAKKMGFTTVALSNGNSKRDYAMSLGADYYFGEKYAEELQKLGGARVILCTAPNNTLNSSLIPGLGRNGKLVILAIGADNIQVGSLQLILNRSAIQGWPSGAATDSEDTLKFCHLNKIVPKIEKYSLAEVEKGYERCLTNQARFRCVLIP